MEIKALDFDEALRYMGAGERTPQLEALLETSSRLLLAKARPRYVYRIFDIEPVAEGVLVKGTNIVLTGRSIEVHLRGCEKAVLLATTLSGDVDRLIRSEGLRDMSVSLALDSLAAVMIEQVCDYVEQELGREYAGYNMTYRFGVGYGDLPLDLQKDFLKVLDAPKRIGLNVTDSNMLTPLKSVTCIIGMSKGELGRMAGGCANCNMRENCTYKACKKQRV